MKQDVHKQARNISTSVVVKGESKSKYSTLCDITPPLYESCLTIFIAAIC